MCEYNGKWIVQNKTQKRGKSNVVVPYEFIAESCEVGKYVEDWVAERDGSAEDDWP